ncbi:hypothetical protein GCM10009670_25920 [Citricoccus alkalitolerans]
MDAHESGQRGELALIVVGVLLTLRTALLVLVPSALGFIGIPSELSNLIVNFGTLAVGCAAIPWILSRAPRPAWVVVWFLAVALVISMLFYGGGVALLGAFGVDLALGLIWLLVMSSISDFRSFRRLLYWGGYVILVATALQLVRTSAAEDEVGYSQFLAYVALPAALIFADAAFERHAFFNAALATAAGVMVMSTGARGPLVTIVLFVAIRGALKMRSSPRLVLLFVGGGAALLVALQYVRDSLLSWLFETLENLGLSTRVVTRLLEGTLLEDRARGALAQHTVDLIVEHPVVGLGLGNERRHVAVLMGDSGPSQWTGWYPHNVFLEVLSQFGVIVGSLILIWVAVKILRAVVATDDMDRSLTALIFVGMGLVPLLFSASYLSWPQFFALIGVCLAAQRLHTSPSALVREAK